MSIPTEEVYICEDCADEGKITIFKKMDVQGQAAHTKFGEVKPHSSFEIYRIPKPVFDGWVNNKVLISCVEAWIEHMDTNLTDPSIMVLTHIYGAMKETLKLSKEEESPSIKYKGKKFDLTKGGVHISNPPKDWGLGLCTGCQVIFETPDWKNEKVFCEDCKSGQTAN